ncbi:MAG TPA: hypothetical protein VK369_04740 [Segetibacter sp.]|nr:hypothetical protein [Segetibacter sp.]
MQKQFARKIKELIRDVLKNSTAWDEGNNDEQIYKALMEAVNKHKPMVIQRIYRVN